MVRPMRPGLRRDVDVDMDVDGDGDVDGQTLLASAADRRLSATQPFRKSRAATTLRNVYGKAKLD